MMLRRSLPLFLLALSACGSSPSTGEEASSSSSGTPPTPPEPDGGSTPTWSALPLPATIDVGYEHTCAIVGDGLLKCWGGSPADGIGSQHGDMAHLKPLDFGLPKRVLTVGLGAGRSCALFEGGTVSCWGNNDQGQLGLGSYGNRNDVFGLPAIDLGAHAVVTQLSVGPFHECAVLEDHSVKCWGSNTYGELGIGDTKRRGDEPGQMGDALPRVDLGPGAEVFQVAAGDNHTCALLRGGTVKCWGLNDHGQLGVGDTKNRGDGIGALGAALPAVDLGASVAVQISTFGNHTCARLQDDSMKCWGDNYQGALGLGDENDRGDVPGELGDALPASTSLGVASARCRSHPATRAQSRTTACCAAGACRSSAISALERSAPAITLVTWGPRWSPSISAWDRPWSRSRPASPTRARG